MSDALKHSLQSIVLSIAALSAAAAPAKQVVNERSADARDVQVLLQSRSISVDLNGTAWVYHGATGLPHEALAEVADFRRERPAAGEPGFLGDAGHGCAGAVGSAASRNGNGPPGGGAASNCS